MLLKPLGALLSTADFSWNITRVNFEFVSIFFVSVFGFFVFSVLIVCCILIETQKETKKSYQDDRIFIWFVGFGPILVYALLSS